MLILGEGMHVWGQRVHGKSVPSSQLYCKPKMVLIKSLKKGIWGITVVTQGAKGQSEVGEVSGRK